MEIKLYGNPKVNQDSKRANAQVVSRHFHLYTDKKTIQEYIIKQNISDTLKNKLLNDINSTRNYEKIGWAYCDNLFNLELLGLEQNTREYIILLDFSDSLDYILHLLSHCDMEAVRNIRDYHKISKSMLNYDFSELGEVKFDVFFGIDSNLDKYLDKLYGSVLDLNNYTEMPTEQLLTEYIKMFYSKILKEVSIVKSYIMRYLKEIDSKIVGTSMSFSSYIGTVDHMLDDLHLNLKLDNFDDYGIDLKIFKRYEYLSLLQ